MMNQFKVKTAKAALLLKEIVNTVPTLWFMERHAKHFTLCNNEEGATLLFSLFINSMECNVVIKNQDKELITISIMSDKKTIIEKKDIPFWEVGRTLMELI